MRLCRFGEGRFGLVRENQVHDVTGVLAELPSARYPFPRHDVLIERLESLRPAIEKAADDAPPLPFDEQRLLSPVANPGKLVAAPVNYRAHLDEVRDNPALHNQNQINAIQKTGLFLKATSSLVGASEGLEIRIPDARTDHEVELAAVIGKRGSRISANDALDHVAAYCIGLDITTRGSQERSMRKSSDGYSVLGPWLVTADEVSDPGNLAFELKVNGEMRQKANTRDMVLTLPELIEYASRYYTLEPGDVIFTGTPEGVAPIVAGDVMAAYVEGIGEMTVKVSE